MKDPLTEAWRRARTTAHMVALAVYMFAAAGPTAALAYVVLTTDAVSDGTVGALVGWLIADVPFTVGAVLAVVDYRWTRRGVPHPFAGWTATLCFAVGVGVLFLNAIR